LKSTYRTECFELDLDDTWRRIEEEGGKPDELAFFNDSLSTRLFISGDRINAEGRDLLELTVQMNAHALGGIAAMMEEIGGSLRRDDPRFMPTPPGFDVAMTAEITGPPDVAHQMLLVTIMNPWVAIYARLQSSSRNRLDLLEDWSKLRPDLFLAQAV